MTRYSFKTDRYSFETSNLLVISVLLYHRKI